MENTLVSTVFLGTDHGMPWLALDGEPYQPVLWETMVFGGPLDTSTVRYPSADHARVGHDDMVERVRTIQGLEAALAATGDGEAP